MSFSARVFRVLIASPSDVVEEREIAVRTIQEWNDLNSHERQVVLLPLRWETHTSPEYGNRPQEVINRQIVDHSDLLVAVFWTRVGSPTGEADSGTLEEIERVADAGKPVMLYFSQSKQDPELIDVDQLSKLREFKKKTFPKALIERYATQVEFRDKLAKQLEFQVRSLIAAGSEPKNSSLEPSTTTDIKFGLAEPQTGKYVGERFVLQTTNIVLPDKQAIPDFNEIAKDESATSSGFLGSLLQVNKNYYREVVSYITRENFFRPVRFWLKNEGGIGARDVYVDLRFQFDNDTLVVASPSSARRPPPTKTSTFSFSGNTFDDDVERFAKIGSQWSTALELRALQPQREVSPPITVFIGAYRSGRLNISANVYADSLPKPITQTLTIDMEVKELDATFADLLKNYKDD